MLLMTALLALTSATGDAGALRCRSDPFVLLSDGTIIDLSADIGVLLTRVQSVDYVLHVPAGRAVIAVIRTPSWPTTVERFTAVADSAPGVYDSTTIVRTSKGNADVTVHLLVKTTLRSMPGFERQPIRLIVRAP